MSPRAELGVSGHSILPKIQPVSPKIDWPLFQSRGLTVEGLVLVVSLKEWIVLTHGLTESSLLQEGFERGHQP